MGLLGLPCPIDNHGVYYVLLIAMGLLEVLHPESYNITASSQVLVKWHGSLMCAHFH